MRCCSCRCDCDHEVEFFERFTSLVGASSFATEPVDASGKSSMVLQAWRGEIQGSGSFELYLEQSMDAEHWSAFNSSAIDPGADTVKLLEICPTMKWVRARIELTGDAATTTWLEGTLS